MAVTMVSWIRRGSLGLVGVLVLAFAVGVLNRDSGLSQETVQPSDGAARAARARGGMTEGGGGGSVGGRAPLSAPGAASLVRPQAGSDATTVVGAPSLPGIGDRIVRTADLSIEVKEGRFDTAWREAFRIATTFDGQVLASNRGDARPAPLGRETENGARDQDLFGDITIRIPADRFEAATNELRGLGTLLTDSTSSEDVTQEYVDLKSRLRHLRAEEDVLVGLMARAKSIEDTLQVQRRLSEVQAEVEQVTGRLNYLDARTEFSTVVLHLAEPGALAGRPGFEEGPSFSEAWETALEGLVRIGSAAMIIAVWLAPFALLGWITLGLRRRARPPVGESTA